MMDATSLEGKVAIVTGAGRGIGRSIALALARGGACLSLAARSQAELQAVQAEIEALDLPRTFLESDKGKVRGGQAASFPADVSREADVVSLVRYTLERFGRLDILVNNAGTGVFKPLLETAAEEWDQVMAVNARGPFLLCREAIPYLRQQERSFIINIASVVGVKGYANQAAYSASKHALLGMTKALAKEVHSDGIRVHAICPGSVDTQLIGRARPDLDRSILMQPEEIADLVLFLVTRPGKAMVDEIHVRRASATPWA